MGFITAKESRVFVNEDHLSGSITGYSVSHKRTYGDVTSVSDDGGRYLPGLLTGGLALRGLFNSAIGDIHEEIAALVGVDNSLLVTVMPDATTVGRPAIFCVSDVANYEVPATVTDAVRLMVEGQPDDGVDWGVSLHAHSAETADGNSTGVDNTASSAGGGVATLHVTAYSGLTNVVFKVQHSTDNSSWSDLITFTTATAVTSERKTVTGTVNRYVRGFWDVTGTGSATFVIAFARR